MANKSFPISIPRDSLFALMLIQPISFFKYGTFFSKRIIARETNKTITVINGASMAGFECVTVHRETEIAVLDGFEYHYMK